MASKDSGYDKSNANNNSVNTTGITTTATSPPVQPLSEMNPTTTFDDSLKNELAALPGVTSVAHALVVAVAAYNKAGMDRAVKEYAPCLREWRQSADMSATDMAQMGTWAEMKLSVSPYKETAQLGDKMIKQSIERAWGVGERTFADALEKAEERYKNNKTSDEMANYYYYNNNKPLGNGITNKPNRAHFATNPAQANNIVTHSAPNPKLDSDLVQMSKADRVAHSLAVAICAFKRAGKDFAVKIYEPYLQGGLQTEEQKKSIMRWAENRVGSCPENEDVSLAERMVSEVVENMLGVPGAGVEAVRELEGLQEMYFAERKHHWR